MARGLIDLPAISFYSYGHLVYVKQFYSTNEMGRCVEMVPKPNWHLNVFIVWVIVEKYFGHIKDTFTKSLIRICFIPPTEKYISILLLYIFNSFIFTDRESLYWLVFIDKNTNYISICFSSFLYSVKFSTQNWFDVTLVLIKLDFRDLEYPSRANTWWYHANPWI